MNLKDKRDIYQAFSAKELLVESVSPDKKVEWRPVLEVMQHSVQSKIQYKISLENGASCEVTEDHSLFKEEKEKIAPVRTSDVRPGDSLIFVEDSKVINKRIRSSLIIPSEKYMYDLSVETNQNFVLESGILAHNSFRPPAHEKFIQGQTQVFGFIWEDEELLEYLVMAVDDFNSRPPVTGIDFSNLFGSERRWRTTIILRAAAFACFAIAMNWIADEFSVGGEERITVRYNDEEKSFRFDHLYRKLRCNEIPKMTQAYESGNLLVRSMDMNNGKVHWKPVKEVMEHDSREKNIIRVGFEKGSVVVTEDHSLFSWKDKAPIRGDELRLGDVLVSEGSQGIQPIEVRSLALEESRRVMYDICVPGFETFVLDSGVVAHNSYSISGVSLDLEKSSKYQSMKDQYINEYDKLIEQNKRSIKIIKGLRQFKFSVGLQSALGPFNTVGSQSRRNYIGSTRSNFM